MASTSTATNNRSLIPYSQPPLPTPPPSQSSLRNPFPPELVPPNRNYIESISRKRRRIEQFQDTSLINGFQLQPHVASILHSDDTSSLQETINNFLNSDNKSTKQQSRTILKSLAHHYPNALAYKLVKLLPLEPIFSIRFETVSILNSIFKESNKLNFTMLIEMKKPLLISLKMESKLSIISRLCGTIGLVAARLYQFRLGSWIELVRYVYDCFCSNVKLTQMKALIMLAELPEQVVENREFWIGLGFYDSIFSRLLRIFGEHDQEMQRLMFNATLKFMKMSKDLERIKACDFLLPRLLGLFHLQYGQDENEDLLEVDLLDMVKKLGDLVTLNIEGIFDGKEGDVFWCMFRVAVKEDASDELKCAAVTVIKELDEEDSDAMECLIKGFSHEQVRAVISFAMDMMSSVVDDPVWYDVDNKNFKDAGLTENYNRGKFLLNLLSFDGDERVFVPIAIEMMENEYAIHGDWRVRYAAMLTIASIAEKHFKGDMILYIDRAVTLVNNSLNDMNHRVLWATMHAIKSLSEYKEILKFGQYNLNFLAKLTPIIKTSLCPRVQACAVIAIRFLVTNCGLEKIVSFAEDIVVLLLVLLKHEKQKLVEEVIETLRSIAVLMPETFCHYDTTMEALTVILSDNSSSSSLFLRAKCLECMGTLVRNFGQDKLEENVFLELVESLISIEGKLSDTDHLARYVILKALDNFCGCQSVSIDKFIDQIMPMLLRYAQLDLDLTVSMPIDLSLDDDKHLVEKVRVQACNILSCCAVRSAEKFSPNVVEVTNIFMRWIGCSSFETRKACMLALPKLLRVIKQDAIPHKDKTDVTRLITVSLSEALGKETDNDLSTRMFKILPKCIKTSGCFPNTELISLIVDGINQALKKIMENEIERVREGRISEAEGDFLPTKETIEDASILIATLTDTFKNGLLIYIDRLMKNVVLFLEIDMPDRVIVFAISIFNILVPQFPEYFPPYHDDYIIAACHALRNDYPHSLMHATRAIGICAKFGKDQFNTHLAKVSVSRLYDVAAKSFTISGQSGDLVACDKAIEALGRICEYHRGKIEGPKVVRNWLNFLPLKHDNHAARSAHELLSRLIRRSDSDLFGYENSNLPKIISVVKEILSGRNILGDQKTIDQMVKFIDQHGGMD